MIAGESRSAAATGPLLRLSQGSYEKSIVARGTENRVRRMDLDGFFPWVQLTFFKADRNGEFQLSDRHRIVDAAGPESRTARAWGAVCWHLETLGQAIRRHRFSAISVNDPHLSGLCGWFLARRHRLPLVVEVVSDYELSYRAAGKRAMPYLPSRRWERWVERWVLRHATAVYADREYYRQVALRSGALRVDRVRATTDDRHYEIKEEDLPDVTGLLPSGVPVLLVVGRLSGEKYPLEMVEALAQLRRSGRQAVLVFVGDGELRAAVERRASQPDVAGQVLLLGNRSLLEVAALLRKSTAVLAGHAGYALLEEALSGTPVVAYDHEWHGEVIREGETGLLARPRDPVDLARQVAHLLDRPEWARQLGAAARAHVWEHHTPDGAAEDERRIWRRVLGIR